MKILITSGGTKVPIDRVRSITNMSRGTFGSRIADAFFRLGHDLDGGSSEPVERITFFMAKGSARPSLQLGLDAARPSFQPSYGEAFKPSYAPVEYFEYVTFDQYKEGVERLLAKNKYDVIVAAAAVSDYGVANYYDGKYRSRKDDMCIRLVKLPKVLPVMRKLAPESVLCGFKLLVDSTEDELLDAMRRQISESGVDLVVGNDLRDIKNDDHQLLVISKHDANPRKYKKDDGSAPRHSLIYPLAEDVVGECLAELEYRRGNGK